MKLRRIILSVFFLFSITIKAQKPVLDINAFQNWPSVSSPALSNDGKYASYIINNQPIGSRTLVLQSIDGNWKIELPGTDNALFTDDSRKAVFMKEKDSLCLLTLGSTSIEDIPNVGSFNLFMYDNVEWMACQLNINDKELFFRNLKTGKQKYFAGARQYWLSKDANTLVIKKEYEKDNKTVQALYWSKFPNGTLSLIWEGDNIGNVVFDAPGSQVVFIVNNKAEKTFWYYKANTAKAVLVANSQTFGIDKDLKLEDISAFSKDGQHLFIKLKEQDFPQPNPDAVKVDVWSYTDAKLQSQQLDEVKPVLFDIFGGHGPQSYIAVLNINDHRIARLEQVNEKITFREDIGVITKTNGGDQHEWNWNSASMPCFYLLNIPTGERRILNKINYPSFSLAGKYLVGTDSRIKYVSDNLISYNLETEQIVNITRPLSIPLNESEVFGSASLRHRDLQIAAWLAEDEAMLIYDKYDIWQIDPTGKKSPLNLTNGYGRKHNIVFSLIPYVSPQPVKKKEAIIISAFNVITKQNGFYRILPGTANPELLTMSNFVYYVPKNDLGACPIKARDAEVYLVHSESTSQSPNYSWTSDCKTFSPLTHVYPEKAYNWITSELLTFTTEDGSKAQGALYKPDNFDAKKKYPVIIHYYENKSDRLNTYHRPEFISDEINIPWFVSNGYIVFTPDIDHKIGKPGSGALNSVVGAAKYLMKFQWVDVKHIGIQGQSFGGYETQYLVTHTNIFAAAMASSGFNDLVNIYGSIMLPDGIPFFRNWAEVGQGRLNATLWQESDVYIKNSPIFQADKVITPLLMMNNKRDAIVPFAQGVEFFTALRRLGKKVWMLQYDNGTHSLPARSNDAKDYTIRMTQFFDHYLKGSPAPLWLTQGIPAKLKGIESRYELDATGRCGNDCKICKQWNEKYKKDPKMFEKPVSEWSLDKGGVQMYKRKIKMNES